MSAVENNKRFLELDAGRVLGDLTSNETDEWRELASSRKDSYSITLDYLAAELEIQHAVPCSLPASLSSQLKDSISDFSNDSSSSLINIFPWLGWAVARHPDVCSPMLSVTLIQWKAARSSWHEER